MRDIPAASFPAPHWDDGRETAGTVDLLIVEPSGKVSIIDWKFIDINTDKYEDVPWYKVKAWNLQMEKYRGILTKNYGVKEEDFGKLADQALADACTGGNPKKVSKEDIIAIYMKAM